MTTVSIHLCAAELQEEVQLEPMIQWVIADQGLVMFVVRTSDPLPDAKIQVCAEGGVIWNSDIRPTPERGLVHPYNDPDDPQQVYVTNRVLTKDDLVIHAEMYEVKLVENGEDVTTIPLFVEFDVEEEEEQEQEQPVAVTSSGDFDTETTKEENDSSIEVVVVDTQIVQGEVEGGNSLNLSTPEQEFEVLSTEEVAEVEETQEENETMAEETEQEVEENGLSTSEEVLNPEEAPNAEDNSEDELMNEMTSDIDEEVKEIPVQTFESVIARLVADMSKEAAFTMSMTPSYVDQLTGQYEVVIEKKGERYSAVVNDPHSRPMQLIVNGDSTHVWEGALESYFDWLETQLMLMFNIPKEDFSNWSKLLITEEPENVELENVRTIERQDVIANIHDKYSAILDYTTSHASLYMLFEEEQKQLTLQVSKSVSEVDSEENDLEDRLYNWVSSMGTTHPLVLGGTPKTNSAPVPETNLAWEVVRVLRSNSNVPV